MFVVVDNEHVSQILIEKGNLQNRTTFIPMSRITPKAWDPYVLKTAERLVNIGCDVLNFYYFQTKYYRNECDFETGRTG